MAEATCFLARAQEPNQGRAINDVLRSAVVHQNLASGCPDRLAHGLKAADAGPHGHIKHCSWKFYCVWLFRKVREALAADADANTWNGKGRRPLHDLCEAVAGKIFVALSLIYVV